MVRDSVKGCHGKRYILRGCHDKGYSEGVSW